MKVQQNGTIRDQGDQSCLYTLQVALMETEMVNPNVKNCWNISGIRQARLRLATRLLFSCDVSPASLAQLQYRCAVCHSSLMIHFPHSLRYCIRCHSAEIPVR